MPTRSLVGLILVLYVAMMQVRDDGKTATTTPHITVTKFEERPHGSALLEVEGKGKSAYLLGPQQQETGQQGGASYSLDGLAAVARWSKTGQLRSVLMQEGTQLQLPPSASRAGHLEIKAAASVTLSLKLISSDQYQLVRHGTGPGVTVELSLPWAGKPTEVNVWDSGHTCAKPSFLVLRGSHSCHNQPDLSYSNSTMLAGLTCSNRARV